MELTRFDLQNQAILKSIKNSLDAIAETVGHSEINVKRIADAVERLANNETAAGVRVAVALEKLAAIAERSQDD